MSRELELKHAIKRVVIYSEQVRFFAEEIKKLIPEISLLTDSAYSTYGINRLKDLESGGSHNYYQWRDFALNFWCGFPSEAEMIDIVSIKGKKPEYFGSNIVFSRLNVFSIDDPVCPNFLSSEKGVSTSIVLRNTEEAKNIAKDKGINELSRFHFGVMVYDSKENISSIVIVPYLSVIEWDDYLGLVKVVR
ncbi:MAG: hypothetical protein ACP5PA_07200 [Elusimicrobiales bacterium]